MRIALIADIHADIRALESALHWVDALGVDRTVCAGDYVGYGSQPDAVVALMRERAIPGIRGNHDRWALERKQVIGLRGWRPAELAAETWEYLESLPAELRVELGGRTLIIHHGSPESDTEYISPYKPAPASVERFRERGEAEVLVLGHTHIPMIDRDPRGTIINPGSILGVPGVQTSYSFAILDLETLAVRVHEVRTGREIRRDPVFLDDEA
jgi:putative phosphoesterase